MLVVVVVVNVLRIMTLPHTGLSKFAFGLWWLSSVLLLLLLSLKTIVIRLDGRFLQPNTFVVPNVREYRISSSIITPWMRRSPVRRFWALRLEGIVVVGLLAPTARVGTTRVGRQGMQRPLHLPTKTSNQANNQRTTPNKQTNKRTKEMDVVPLPKPGTHTTQPGFEGNKAGSIRPTFGFYD